MFACRRSNAVSSDRRQAVLEIGLHRRLFAVRTVVVDPVLAAVREQSCQGYEMSKEFLFDAALLPTVEF